MQGLRMENVDLSLKLKECEMKDEEREALASQLVDAHAQIEQERGKVQQAWQSGFEAGKQSADEVHAKLD